MKNLTLTICLLLIISIFQELNYSQTRNPVLEYCTGTWCQWCPCAHSIIKNEIMPAHPNVIVISYHGPANGSDPFSFFSGNTIISALGFSGYPTGIVDRTSAPQSRSAWLSNVANRKNVPATVSISSTRIYNPVIRELNLTINSTALSTLTGSYYLNVILLEDSLIHAQTGNTSCPGGTNYVHDNVVRAMVNGATGELLTNTNWDRGQVISRQIKYTIPNNVVEKNASVVAMVYKQGTTLNTSEIQQAEKWRLLDTTATSIKSDLKPVTEFELFQNYPNPFNPSTIIAYQSPQNGFHSLKVFNLIGKEVAVLVNEYRNSGNYEIEFDATNLPAGVYFYQLTIGNFTKTLKMQIIK